MQDLYVRHDEEQSDTDTPWHRNLELVAGDEE